MSKSEIESMIRELRLLAERIVMVREEKDPRSVKRARLAIEEVTRSLSIVAAELDTVIRPNSVFDPTSPETAGRIIALTLVAQPKHLLTAVPVFYGSGVYAIYYKGDFNTYKELSGKEHPIYVGKADPDTQSAKDAITQGTKLSMRLNEHARSIRNATSTLKIDDFECRFLIVQTGFQKSAEDYLINFFKPIWNSETKICFGLGKHGDSSETRGNKRSPWDTMHPGRKWANSSSEDQKPKEQIVEEIAAHLHTYPPYRDIHQIFDRFISDMGQLNPQTRP